MSEPVTLADPVAYFELLDRASMSHWWGRSIEHVERRWVRHGLRLLGKWNEPRWNWLDIGCGTGARLRKWANWECWRRRIGIEPDPSAVAVAQTDPSLEVLAGSLPELPIDGETYDLVTALDVLQHVESSQRREAIRSIARRTRGGGLLLLRTNAPGLFRDSSNDASIVHPRALDLWLVEAGFRIVRRSQFNACGALLEELLDLRRGRRTHKSPEDPFKMGLPRAWSQRPTGHPLAACCGFMESRILATGLVNFPIGHSYLVMAIRDGDHDRAATE